MRSPHNKMFNLKTFIFPVFAHSLPPQHISPDTNTPHTTHHTHTAHHTLHNFPSLSLLRIKSPAMAHGHTIQLFLSTLKRLGRKTKKVRFEDSAIEMKSTTESDSESFGCPLKRVPTPYYHEMKPIMESELESEPEPYGLRRVPTPYPVFMTTGRVNYTI